MKVAALLFSNKYIFTVEILKMWRVLQERSQLKERYGQMEPVILTYLQ